MDQKKNNSGRSGSVKGNRDVVFLCGSFLISVAFLYFFLSPLYQNKLVTEKVYAAKQEELKDKQTLLENIATFNRENKDLTVNSKKLVLLIPNRNNYEDFFVHLQQLSKNYNLELLSFSLADVKGSDAATVGTVTSTGAIITPEGTTGAGAVNLQTNQQGVNISLRGDFASFLGFAKALENGVPFLQEDRLSISTGSLSELQPGQPSDQNPMLDFVLNLRFIYY